MRRESELSTLSIGWRVLLSMAITLVLVGAAGYLFAEGRLKELQVDAYELLQKQDVRSVQNAASNDATNHSGIHQVRQAINEIGNRSVVSKAQVIGPGGVVVAAEDPLREGRINSDPDVASAMKSGGTTARIVKDEATGSDEFKYVSPVLVGGNRDALYVTYNSKIADERLEDIRLTLILTGLLTLLLGSVVFYLVAGRAMIRDHRLALERSGRDGLTGLLNQRSFAIDLERVSAASERVGDPLSLVLLDIDDFMTVNEREGRAAGDIQLEEVARILEHQGVSDLPYRIGEDDFALLMPIANPDAATAMAGDLSEELRRRGIIVSIGASTAQPGISGEVLRAEALAALKEARRRGGNGAVHFDDLRGEVTITQPDKIDAVRMLISEEGLTTAFQPIWDFRTRQVMAYEALTRPDPRYGLSGPAEAFDIAEQLGQVHKLDEICIRSAFLTSGAISGDKLLFVNLSPQTLDIDASQRAWLREMATHSKRSPGQIVIEVTERFGGRMVSVMKRLHTLRGEGFKIALDDVGTGNSGLEMLGRINADFIKIDRSIVVDAPVDPASRAVLTVMALFAEQTGTFVIAEGIENAETLEYVQGLAEPSLGIPTVVSGGQGYGLGRPSVEIPEDPVWPLD